MGVTILVTGVEQSGTGVVATILREAGGHVTHRAVPHYNDWSEFAKHDTDRVVVVVRGLAAHCASIAERSGERIRRRWAPQEHRAAGFQKLMAGLSHRSDVLVVTYESLTSPREVECLCGLLGLDATRVRTTVEDRNSLRYGDLGPMRAAS